MIYDKNKKYLRIFALFFWIPLSVNYNKIRGDTYKAKGRTIRKVMWGGGQNQTKIYFQKKIKGKNLPRRK
jgi:hypothetical protein